jgi:hypothetical protein
VPIALTVVERIVDRPLSGRRTPARALGAVGLAYVVALQWLAGFAQTAYYCLFHFFGYGAVRLSWRRPRSRRGAALLMVMLVVALGLGVGTSAPLLAAMVDVSRGSAGAEGLPFEWTVLFAYHPSNLLTLLVPYVHGDASDGTFTGEGTFWEEYAYVGLLPILCEFATLLLMRRDRRVRALACMVVLALLLILGPRIPGYRLVHEHLPKMKSLRFSTRALFIVELMVRALAALGLARFFARRSAPLSMGGAPSRGPRARVHPTWMAALPAFIWAATAVDLGSYKRARMRLAIDARGWSRPTRHDFS